MTVDIGNFDSLLDTYYRDEINELEAQESRTPEENERLQNLKDYYELCLNYMLVLQEEFGYGGGGGGSVSLEGVTLTEITGYACTFIGKPYVWGGNDPHTGADCSGFVKYVYEHFGATGIPRVAKDQVKVGVLVPSLEEALPGDLLFFSSDGTDSGVYHVAMYLGNGKMVHASSPKTGIIASNVSGVYKIKRIAQ